VTQLTFTTDFGGSFNPFMPDDPVRPELFVGRKPEVATIERAIGDTVNGRGRNILIRGDKGIGKTSIARYIGVLASGEDTAAKYGGRLFIISTSLGTCEDVEDVTSIILEDAYKSIRAQSSKIVDKTKVFFQSLDAFGINLGPFGISFSRERSDRGKLHLNFHNVINELYDKIADEYSGILVIFDELDTIALNKKFAPFLKSYLEQLSGLPDNRIMNLITASPSAIEGLEQGHDTILRSFTPLELNLLRKEETEELVNKALEIGIPDKTANNDFLTYIHKLSSGIPNFIHEIGKASFDVDGDSVLGIDDLTNGVFGTDKVVGALQNLEIKYFRKRYTQDVLSNRYRRILIAFASFDEDEVKIGSVRSLLSEEDKQSASEYVRRMVERGVLLKVEGKQGYYSLPDRMFKLFLNMENPEIFNS